MSLPQFYGLFQPDCSAINIVSDCRSSSFGDPERIPDSERPEKTAQNKCRRNNNNDIAAQCNDQGTPLPNPSSAPEDVTEIADTRKPALIIRRAVSPAWMVSGV